MPFLTEISEDHKSKWSQKMRHVVALKAALWANGNEEKLLEIALKSYSQPIPLSRSHCYQCDIESDEVLGRFDTGENQAVFEHVPMMVCPNCANQTIDLFIAAELERLAMQLPTGTVMTLEDALNI